MAHSPSAVAKTAAMPVSRARPFRRGDALVAEFERALQDDEVGQVLCLIDALLRQFRKQRKHVVTTTRLLWLRVGCLSCLWLLGCDVGHLVSNCLRKSEYLQNNERADSHK